MPPATLPFDSLYRHGLARVAVCIPNLKVADTRYNVDRTIALARQAADKHAVLALFPELGLSAYSNEDLFHQDALLDASLAALHQVAEASRDLAPLLLVGTPLDHENKLFNCAVAIHRGRILGVTPKSYLPNYREFYEKRQFTSAFSAATREICLLDQTAPFGSDIIYLADDLPGFALHAEICEDVWTPIPPSTLAALAGATILANLSASNITIGKAAYRQELCASQSAKCLAAYLYAAAGAGESTTDLAWDGHALIYENGALLAESERFSQHEQIITADIDLDRLRQERLRTTSFNDTIGQFRQSLAATRRVHFEIGVPTGEVQLERAIDRFPYVPGDPAVWNERCYEAYNIQVTALAQRLQATGIKKIVIGVSGGLDSTHALLVACKCLDRLALPRTNVLAYTLPGFATTDRTKSNAWKLMQALGVSAQEIDIRPACQQMLADINHPASRGEAVYDITFENVQAGQRTSHLFRLANLHGGLVLGTSDLSELALGWSTYGVGDHMSHYAINASVPKTLIQHLIRWVIQTRELPEANPTLQDILETEISPELIPIVGRSVPDRPAPRTNPAPHEPVGWVKQSADPRGEYAPSADNSDPPTLQSTESTIGPYELQDFNLYHLTRYGLKPSKVAYLAWHAWRDRTKGNWPLHYPDAKREQYDLATIKHWLRVFLHRFFQTSQYKRSAIPNAPKVGSGGSLSPRGDWRAPSDSESKAWLEELDQNVPDQ